MCNSIASLMSWRVSSMVAAAATHPGRSGIQALKPVSVGSMKTVQVVMLFAGPRGLRGRRRLRAFPTMTEYLAGAVTPKGGVRFGASLAGFASMMPMAVRILELSVDTQGLKVVVRASQKACTTIGISKVQRRAESLPHVQQ
jgi:hypothetical protein